MSCTNELLNDGYSDSMMGAFIELCPYEITKERR